ncbi:class I SAM-dependent methyltransferase [Brevibacillus ginsengisoli]|uniref:class I SAM-dependent methyltransferase n=1 Tax=Brevibacillus ginsengisoli TaxID=363854 RepID=UPI003CF13A10
MSVSSLDLASVLDEMVIECGNQKADYDNTLRSFCKQLQEIKKSLPFDKWKDEVARTSLTHPLQKFLLKDPFTRRALTKPRGYAGDAIMMDMLYAGDGTIAAPFDGTITKEGKRLFESVLRLSTAEGVRNRKYMIANRLDEFAETNKDTGVLAVASGHLREARHSTALYNGKIGKYVALDNDPLSIEQVRQEVEKLGVTAVEGSVLDLIRERMQFSSFDFIYSAGLYDYLQEKVAKRLTGKLFRMLRPGGVLLIANFHPDHLCSAYIEACCDWWLVYRDEAAMKDLLTDIPQGKIGTVKLYRDPTKSILFLEVTRIA